MYYFLKYGTFLNRLRRTRRVIAFLCGILRWFGLDILCFCADLSANSVIKSPLVPSANMPNKNMTSESESDRSLQPNRRRRTLQASECLHRRLQQSSTWPLTFFWKHIMRVFHLAKAIQFVKNETKMATMCTIKNTATHRGVFCFSIAAIKSIVQ